MKISPLDTASFSLWPSKAAVPAHRGSCHQGHHHPAGCVQRAEHADHRRDCDDHREGRREIGDRCAFPRQSYQDYLHKQNLREHDRFESCRPEDRGERSRYERPSCRGHRDARDVYDMPKIGDVSKSEFNRAVERAVQTYLIRAITNTGGSIDLFV